jgi:PAS domain S-box-containing protein
MKRWSVEAQVLAGFSLTVAVVVIVGASLYRTTIGFIDTSGAALRSQQALVALEGIFSLLNQAESQQRIYLLLGEAVDLAPRHEAVARMNSLMAELDELTADDPALHARLPALRQHIAERMTMLEAVLKARHDGGFEAGQRQLAASPGREAMQQVRAMVASMQTELGTRLRQRQHDAQQNAQRTLAMLGLLLLFVAAALAALYARIRRESRERRDSEERLRAVVETAADGIITIDANGSIQSFNPAAERLFGHAAAEVIGRNVSLLMPEPHRSGHDGYLQRYLESGEPHVIGVGREVMAQRRDGSPIPVGLAVSEMHLGARRLFTGILHDLTEAKRAEQRQTQLIHDLQNVNEELKSFAYVVSHDLKAPLRGVGSLADWLMTDYADKLDDQGREYLSLVKGRVSRMDALIDGILEYSRVGRINDTQTAIDLNVLVSDIIQLLAPPAGVTVTVDGPLPTLFGGRTRLQQVFQNLISNAIKHLDKPVGRIRVACADQGDAWQFSISDNGPGIEARHFERIFQLFQVLTPRDQKESTGVGLALVKKIVELHGGRVWLESRVGEGSTFFFTLPKTGTPNTAGEQAP